MFTQADQTAFKASLQELGRLVTHTRRAGEHYDPQLQRTVVNETTQDIYGILSSYSIAETDGMHILREDRKLSLPGDMEPAPHVGDTITIGSDLWNIEQVSPVQPAAICLVYKTQIRKQT